MSTTSVSLRNPIVTLSSTLKTRKDRGRIQVYYLPFPRDIVNMKGMRENDLIEVAVLQITHREQQVPASNPELTEAMRASNEAAKQEYGIDKPIVSWRKRCKRTKSRKAQKKKKK